MAELASVMTEVQDHSFSLVGFMGELNLEVERLEERAVAAALELERSRAAQVLGQDEQLRKRQVLVGHS